MNVETIVVGEFMVNCYVVWGDQKEAIIIDPGKDSEDIIAVLKNNDLKVASYMLTHGHMDHIHDLAAMHNAYPAPIGLHADDLKWAFSDLNQMPPIGVPDEPSEDVSRLLEDGQEWTDGGLTYKIMATPGHTMGGVCFYFENEKTVFTGDTLFAGSIGRTDLAGGNAAIYPDSLKLLAGLPDDTTVYTGHGPSTTIGHEKQYNFFLSRQEI